MAETTKTQNSVAQNSSMNTQSVCSIPGCVHHEEGTTKSGTENYKFRVHFMSKEQIYEHAVESMQRVVAQKARSGKGIPVATNGAFVDIDHKGGACETYENLTTKLAAMSADERTAYQRSLQMQLDALKKAQSTSYSDAKTG